MAPDTAVTAEESSKEFAMAPVRRGSVKFGTSREKGDASDSSFIFGKIANNTMAITGNPTMMTSRVTVLKTRAGASRLFG